MTIALLQSGIRINGASQNAKSRWTLSDDQEAQLVGRGVAQYVDEYEGAPAGMDLLGRVVPPGWNVRADMLAAGLLLEPITFSGADGQIVYGECWLYAVRPTSGTTPTLDLHNGTSTSNDLVLGGLGTLTVGTLYYAAGEGALVHCPKGLYGNLGGTSPVFTVLVVKP